MLRALSDISDIFFFEKISEFFFNKAGQLARLFSLKNPLYASQKMTRGKDTLVTEICLY